MSEGLSESSSTPAPTPAESPRAKKKKKRAGMTEHEHLVDLDRAVEKILALQERDTKRADRVELLLELVCLKLGIVPPARVP